ncbi:MAG TPA: PqqD family protein [Polyangia bacterium]
MIFTVFCASTSAELGWQSQLLAHSWVRAGQPGELVRLVASTSSDVAPCHPRARDVKTTPWSPHPYTGEVYAPYNKAAALMEWLFVEPVEGTVLLLEPSFVFRAPVTDEVRPGEAKATAWAEMPRGEGPLGLPVGFEFLEQFCVDRAMTLPPVTLPLLIHTTDLRKIAARWLELMSLIRIETGQGTAAVTNADQIAYAIAATESGITHTNVALRVTTDAGETQAPILDCRQPVLAPDGTTVWDAGKYAPWDVVPVESARPGVGRELLGLLGEMAARHEPSQKLAFLKPRRLQGVREGKILGSLFLEIPGRADTVSLNSSGAAIWEVCDGSHSVAEINQRLESRFEMTPGSLQADIEVVIKRLEDIGALRLETI